jgi:hypothetical protein
MTARTGKYTAAGGVTTIGEYIPEIWSGKLIEKFYAASVFPAISNTDYEGEIKKYGDQVHIRITPDITIRDYEIGQSLTYERPSTSKVELDIDQGKYYAVAINAVEEKQADINYVSTWATDASEQMKVTIDTAIFSYIGNISSTVVDSNNTGTTAGKISGNINLGVDGTPFSLTKANIIDKILECGQALDEQNRPENGRWMVLPAWAITRLKGSDIKDASLTGDGTSVLRNGRVGMIDRFEIFSSNHVLKDTDDTAWSCMFGDKNALTFASQLTENEVIPNPDDFGDLMRGLQVYGRKVVDDDGMGILYASIGTEA